MSITKLSLLLSHYNVNIGASLLAQMVKNLPATPETWVQSLGRSPGGGNGCHFSILFFFFFTSVLLPGEFHGQRSLVGYSPWGHKKVGHNWTTNTLLNINIYAVDFVFSHVAWLAGCYIPNQGLNLRSQQSKCEVLTTGPPRNSHIDSLEKSLKKGILKSFILKLDYRLQAETLKVLTHQNSADGMLGFRFIN